MKLLKRFILSFDASSDYNSIRFQLDNNQKTLFRSGGNGDDDTRAYRMRYFGCSAPIAGERELAIAHRTSKARTNKCQEVRSKRRTLISRFFFSLTSTSADRNVAHTIIIIFGFSYGDGGGGGRAATLLYVIVNHSKNFASLRGILFMH